MKDVFVFVLLPIRTGKDFSNIIAFPMNRYCIAKPRPFTSRSSKVSMKFVSDNAGRFEGFSLMYTTSLTKSKIYLLLQELCLSRIYKRQSLSENAQNSKWYWIAEYLKIILKLAISIAVKFFSRFGQRSFILSLRWTNAVGNVREKTIYCIDW